jgi:Ca2+-binding RTX toxin-like protein
VNGGGGVDTISTGIGIDAVTYDLFNASSVAYSGSLNGGADTDYLGARFYSAGVIDLRSLSIASMEQLTLSDPFFQNLLCTTILNANQIGGALNTVSSQGTIATLQIEMGALTSLNLSALQFDAWDASDKIVINGDGDSETINGTSKSDTLNGGLGADTLNGGAGVDTASYAGGAAITVDLGATATYGYSSEGDILLSIENLIGSSNADILLGDGLDNWIDGGLGADTIKGQGGVDTLTYENKSAGITVDLGATATYGYSTEGDIIIGIENLVGTGFNDILFGDGKDNVFEGGAGADTIRGQAGIDTITYEHSATAVTVDLGATPTYGYSFDGVSGDVLIGVENIVGTALNDILLGDGLDNRIEGGAGSDTINGKGGIDTVTYEHSTTAVILNLSATPTYGYSFDGVSGDILVGIENVVGSSLADNLVGDAGNNLFEGGAGSDYINGLGGSDTVTYVNSATAISLDLAAAPTYGYSFDGTSGDILLSIENMIGSSLGDILYGDAQANTIDGGLGSDILKGGLGADTFRFTNANFGNDQIMDYLDGTDRLSFGVQAATAFGNFTLSGNDTAAVTVNLTGGGSIVLISATNTAIHIDASDFIFV